jgi:hypothetical protein
LLVPTATPTDISAAIFLTSTTMIVIYFVVGLLLICSAAGLIVWARVHRPGRIDVNEGLVESLVDDANLPTEGTIEL